MSMSSFSPTLSIDKISHYRRQTWTGQSRHRCNPNLLRWYSVRYQKHQRLSKRKSIQYYRHFRQTTMSTLTSSTDCCCYSNKVITVKNDRSPPIFHKQSLLFLFGFLFFPCWWIGGYYLDIPCKDDNEQVWTIIHPSLIANGKTSCKILWLPGGPKVKSREAYEKALFYRWNRIMSQISVGFIILITALFIWYFIMYGL